MFDSIENFRKNQNEYNLLDQTKKENIVKSLLEKYKVEYDDPTNFIYVANNTTFEKVDLFSALQLYMNFYDEEIITYPNQNITSFPVYPKMKSCDLNSNKITKFYIQPEMDYCSIYNNKLTEFPVQPEMIFCNLYNNHINHFPEQPKLKILHI